MKVYNIWDLFVDMCERLYNCNYNYNNFLIMKNLLSFYFAKIKDIFHLIRVITKNSIFLLMLHQYFKELKQSNMHKKNNNVKDYIIEQHINL